MFDPLNPKFSDFFNFENRSCSSRQGNRMAFYPIEIGLTVLEILKGAESAPSPSPVNVLQKANQ